MSNFYKRIFIGLLTFLPCLAWSVIGCSMQECPKSQFIVEAEYLYFQPLLNNNFIAGPNFNGEQPFNLHPVGPGKKNKFDYSSGLRLQAYYNQEPSGLIESIACCFTCLPAKSYKNYSLDSFLSLVTETPECGSDDASMEIPGKVKSNHRLDYYAADLLLTIPVFKISCWSFSAQPGIHFAWMNYNTQVRFSTNTEAVFNSGTLKEKSQTCGIGPELGINVQFRFNNYVSLKGGIKGGLLVSKAKARFHIDQSLIEEEFQSAHARSLWKTFPFWDTTLSVCFSFEVKGYQMDAEIGYEYLSYPDFINRIQFPSEGSYKAVNAFSNFDFQGPFVSILLSF